MYAFVFRSDILRAKEAPTPTAVAVPSFGFSGLFLAFFAGSLFCVLPASPEFASVAEFPLLFLFLSVIFATVSPSFPCLPSSTASFVPFSLASGLMVVFVMKYLSAAESFLLK